MIYLMSIEQQLSFLNLKDHYLMEFEFSKIYKFGTCSFRNHYPIKMEKLILTPSHCKD